MVNECTVVKWIDMLKVIQCVFVNKDSSCIDIGSIPYTSLNDGDQCKQINIFYTPVQFGL